MSTSTENTGPATATSSATPRPRTLEALLDREERLATQGLAQQAELLGGDALDLLNLPLHFRRKPIGTSAFLAAAGMFLVSQFGRSKHGKPMRRYGRAPGGPLGLFGLAKSLVSTSVVNALLGRMGPAASSFTRRARL
jgi:hypothetical protein